MLKTLVRIFLIVILILVLTAVLFRHTLCQLLIEALTAHVIGLKLFIEELNLDILNNSLSIRGITLFNPPGFKNEVLGKAKEIFMKYDLLGFLSGRLHLQLVKVDISEINIIRNEKRSSNLPTFRKKGFSTKSSPDVLSTSLTKQKVKKSKRKEHPKFLIDRLELSLEKVTFMDHRARIGKPAVIIFTVKDPYVFKNITDLKDVVDSLSAKGGFRNLLTTEATEKK